MIKFLKGKNLIILALMCFVGIAVGGQSLLAIGEKLIENYQGIIKFNEGYYSNLPIQTASTITGAGMTNTGNQTISGTLTVSGATVVEGLTTGGSATVLTDANGGTYTLTQAELIAAGVLEFAAGGEGQAVIALKMPATSTMTALIPNAGDCKTWLYDASALAAATTTTLTKGTGHHIIAYTANDDLIDGAEFAQIQMCRRTDTDVNTIVSELVHAD